MILKWISKLYTFIVNINPGSAISNRRVPKSCLGRVLNYKLGRVATLLSNCIASMQPHQELKTQPRVRPVSLSLYMINQLKIGKMIISLSHSN